MMMAIEFIKNGPSKQHKSQLNKTKLKIATENQITLNFNLAVEDDGWMNGTSSQQLQGYQKERRSGMRRRMVRYVGSLQSYVHKLIRRIIMVNLIYQYNIGRIYELLIMAERSGTKRKIQKALVVEEYGGKVMLKDVPMPELQQGQVLIRVQASTINPSDKLLMLGACFDRPLPSICGIEGTGRVVDGKGEAANLWIGVRVCFISPCYGSWVQYSVTTVHEIFEIEEDVPVQCAACGLINPLTAIGFVDRFRATGCKYGMINTAAASALGRMLIRICNKQNIPLLNVVHREQQKQMLLAEGARHVLVSGNIGWQKQYKELLQQYRFDCLFDALGGGAISEVLISNLLPESRVFAYGALEGKPIVVSSVLQLLKGMYMEGFLIFSWWGNCSEETQLKIRENLSYYLTHELATKQLKGIGMHEIDEGLELSATKASEGKVIIRIHKSS